jgi:hypothetical protein
MRTAGRIRAEHKFFEAGCCYGNSRSTCRSLERMINDARKEAIEECAKRLVINEGSCGEFGEYQAPFIEPESIQNLINELK